MQKRKRRRNALSTKPSMYASGVFFILLALLFLLSSGTRLWGLGGYLFAYPFGMLGYFGIPLIIVLCSLGLFHDGLAKALGLRFAAGAFALLIAGCALFSSIVYLGENHAADISYYNDIWTEAKSIRFGISTSYRLAGGVIGFGISSWFPSNLTPLAIAIESILILAAIFLMAYPFWKSCFLGLKAAKAISRASRAKKEEERKKEAEEEEQEETSRIDMEEEEPKPSPLTRLRFELAGASTFLSRRKKREGNTDQPDTIDVSDPTPVPAERMPVPSSSRTHHAPRVFGLQEAVFRFGEESPVAEHLTPAPTPAPVVEQPAQYEVAPTPPTPSPVQEDPLIPSFEQPSAQASSSIFVSEEEEEEQPVPAIPTPAPFEALPLDNPPPAPPAAEQPAAPEPVAEDGEPEVAWPAYQYPSMDLLNDPDTNAAIEEMEQECQQKIAIINQAFIDLHVGAHVAGYTIGPSVTRFAIQPDRNVSVSTLGRYIKDLEARLGGVPCRYVERVAGLTMPAIETANSKCRLVSFKECLSALPPVSEKTRMLVPFGVKIDGEVVYANMAEFPHLLLAGTTGSGKSIFVHSILLSLIMRNRPEELKLVLVDPKRVEMTKYRDIPHLLCPIVKEPVHAKNALKKLVEEMERRYRLFDASAVQKIEEYNTDYAPVYHKKKLPYIVLVVDEFADLVNNCKEVSDYVLVLGAKARAAGIHMIIATQRPDVKVISGTIKANLPTTVALSVRTVVDSNVILGAAGAEDLAGHGDMLIDCAQVSKKDFLRAQGCFVDSRELRAIADYIRAQQKVSYHPGFMDLDDKEEAVAESPHNEGGSAPYNPSGNPGASMPAGEDDKYEYIKSMIMQREFTSISSIQREFSVGFPRAGKIFARLQKEGIVDMTPVSASKGCRVLVHEVPSEHPGSESSSSVEPSWKTDPEEDII